MGTEVEAFVGPLAALRGWREQLESVVVYRLTPEWGLAPATTALFRELGRRFGLPADSQHELSRKWGGEASANCALLYYTDFEFGDQGDDLAVVWRGGQKVLPFGGLNEALALLGLRREEAGIDRYRHTDIWAAAAILQELEDRAAIGGILEGLRHPNPDVRRLATGGLSGYGSAAEVALPILVEMARKDTSLAAQLSATAALSEMGATGALALRDLLSPDLGYDPWGAILALGKMGPEARVAVGELAGIVRTGSERERREAAESLGKIGKDAAEAVPALIGALRDRDPFVRYHAVVALGQIGPDAGPAIPALRAALQDPDRSIPWAAIVSLGRIGPLPLKEALAALRTAANWTVRSNAAKLLGEWGVAAETAIPGLIEALGDRDHSVRSNAATALGRMGAAAREALPALRQALDDRYCRKAATDAIQRIESGGD